MSSERDVIGEMTAGRAEAADVGQRATPEGHALTVGQHPRRRWSMACSHRAEAVDQRRQHRRVQPTQTGRRADEARPGREQVPAVVGGAGDEGCWERGVGLGVGVEGDDPLGRCRVEPLLQRPRFADPSTGQRSTDDDASAESRRDRRRRVARFVVDDDHLVHAGRADDGPQARFDPRCLVARRDDHRDRWCRRRLGVGGGSEWRVASCRPAEPHQRRHCRCGPDPEQ